MLNRHNLEYKDWGLYDRTTRLIKAIPGKIIVIKTHNEKYVKLRVDSFYKDKKELEAGADHKNTENGYFTFTFMKG